jgi:hypothetical protein
MVSIVFVLSLAIRTAEFVFYHLLLPLVEAELIVTLKREIPAWGQRRIREELRRMGVRVSEPTIVRILRDHGFSPRPGRKVCFDRVRAAAKDALWALDFFWVKSAKRVWLHVLLVTLEPTTKVSVTPSSN